MLITRDELAKLDFSDAEVKYANTSIELSHR